MAGNPIKKSIAKLKAEDVLDLINEAGIGAFGGDFDLFTEIFHNIRDVADPSKRAELLLKVADYVFPKRAAIKLTDGDDKPLAVDYTAAIGRFLDLVDAKMHPQAIPAKYHDLIDVTPVKTPSADGDASSPTDAA